MFGPGDGVIRVGDSSSHGGTVVTGQANYLVDGIPVAVVGDMVACPQKGHGYAPSSRAIPHSQSMEKPLRFMGARRLAGLHYSHQQLTTMLLALPMLQPMLTLLSLRRISTSNGHLRLNWLVGLAKPPHFSNLKSST